MRDWKKLPIYSFYGGVDEVNYNTKTLYSTSRIRPKSNIFSGKSINIQESGCLIHRLMTYNDGVFTISSFFKTRTILPGTVKNYSRFFKRIIMNTNFGLIEFNTKTLSDAKAIEFILYNF